MFSWLYPFFLVIGQMIRTKYSAEIKGHYVKKFIYLKSHEKRTYKLVMKWKMLRTKREEERRYWVDADCLSTCYLQKKLLRVSKALSHYDWCKIESRNCLDFHFSCWLRILNISLISPLQDPSVENSLNISLISPIQDPLCLFLV